MVVQNKALVLDLVQWIAEEPRPYAEVMEAWRTSCPRLPIWEDAVDLGFVVRLRNGVGDVIDVTPVGRAFLRSERGSAVHEEWQPGDPSQQGV
ncbi:MAG TPA: hypothetical protein VEZ14_03790 [Dehalococcoidia bacterium]|nr:hypothetical protein [Dehalococcoidia bacterium]